MTSSKYLYSQNAFAQPLSRPTLPSISKIYTISSKNKNKNYTGIFIKKTTSVEMLSVRNLRKTFTDATESSGVEFR